VASLAVTCCQRTSGTREEERDHMGIVNGPLGLAIAPNGDVLTVNSGDGNIVETTPAGRQVATKALDTSGSPAGAGARFGLAVAPHGNGVYFVDDATNQLNLLH
jgi:DNA-binding beta-propeller fold protein YncE